MYWEQLELRCRSLYSGAPPMPPGPAIIGTPRGGPCRCCEQCHAHRAAIPSAYPWDGDSRFWAGQAGNFYSPNPGGDEGNRMGSSGNVQGRNRSWNWPRMPWQRNDPSPPTVVQQPPQPTQRFCGPISSSDSQYGFSNGTANMNDGTSSQQNGYSVIGGPYGVWGPPPPYSDPNSPARRGRYQYIHPNPCHPMLEQHIPPNQPILECHQHTSSSAADSHSEIFCQQASSQLHAQQQQRNAIKRQTQFKTKENYENTPSDSDGGRFSNTLPARKTKKRVDIAAANKSIGPNQPQTRVNVQNVFNNLKAESEASENEYNEPSHPHTEPSSTNPTPQHRRVKLGIENTGFQPIDATEHGELINGNAESEVYFADVSSCCNISVKNDNSFYEDANHRRSGKGDKNDADEYLSQRFGKKESSSIRSRLPFPQMIPEDFEKSPVINKQQPVVPAPRTSIIQKEISRQSMCSIDSGEKTDFTDLSPATPTVNFQPYPNQDSFVASFPYNEPSQEAHRRSTKNLHDIFLSNDSQYETIKDSNQYETTPLTLNYELNHDMSSSSISSSSYSNNKSSPIHYSHNGTPTNKANGKSINVTPIKRQNLGTNISAIIQNLSSDLYPENANNLNNNNIGSGHQSPQHKIQKQDCNNDVINSNIVVNSSNCSEKQKEWSELNGNDRRL
jgi:hypothetical protein